MKEEKKQEKKGAEKVRCRLMCSKKRTPFLSFMDVVDTTALAVTLTEGGGGRGEGEGGEAV